jgi:hypothetical protein
MSDSSSRLPARPSLEQLRKQAKDLLKKYRAGDQAAAARFRAIIPRPEDVALADAQFVLAREYGFESWAKLAHHIEAIHLSDRLQPYELLVKDIVLVCRSDDAEALQRIENLLGRTYPYPDRRTRLEKQLVSLSGPVSRIADITPAEAQLIVAREFGFQDWAKLVESVAQPPNDPRSAPLGISATPPFYKIDWKESILEPRPPLSDKDWDTIFGVMEEHRIAGLNAGGQMTDAAMGRLPRLKHLTHLNLGGSTLLTNEGIKHLARMPQLQELDLSGSKIRVTDRGLEVLRNLTKLRRFEACWAPCISDVGVANLAFCDHLECVNLLGTLTGDGAIRALSGKRTLCRFKTGRQVTDAGIPALHQIPAFKIWQGGDIRFGLMSFEAEPTHLLLDGPITDEGLASIVGLDGLAGLTFFWHISALTANCLKPVATLPSLAFLGCQESLCDDVAMRHIGEMSRLRMLMCQGTVAGDDGFEALSRSETIEYIWGRECPNLTGRGFAALAAMPALRGLAVSCKNVDDAALSALPRFPALRGLMPMDVHDDGFRYVGRCEQLEDLWCMYCRDTGDTATGHIAGLSKLKTYYAGATQITDRSLEILGRMSSLESVEFYECAGISDEGVERLAGLPRMREVTIGGSPGVTREGAAVFPARVRVNYWT